MPTQVSYPGVYVEEIPSGVRTITGVATSITAFLGRARRGPDNEPITINSYGDFERIFGGLWIESSLGFAVRDFFLNGGSRAIIVRLYSPELKKTEPGAPEPPPAAAPLSIGDIRLVAAYKGKWGENLRATIDNKVSKEVALRMNLSDGDLFNLTVRDISPGGVTEQFRNLSLKDSSRRIDKVLQAESNLVRWSGDEPKSTLALPTFGGDGTKSDDITALPEVKKAQEDAAKKLADLNKAVPIDQTAVAAATTAATAATTAATAATTAATAATTAMMASDGNPLTEADFLPGQGEAQKKGIYALEKADLFNLLCIPPYVLGGNIDNDLIARAAVYCEKRRAFLIVDPPSEWNTKDKARDAVDTLGTRSNHAAVFFPRLKQPNPLRDNQIEEFVPCGVIAGIFARTDAQRGVWKAPAGLDAKLIGVPELSVPLTDPENGELNPLGVNCLRAFPAMGRVVWGARTLQGDDRLASEWKYIPVRRLALFMEESLYRGTQWAVFEPNDEPLWSQLRLNIGAFMNTLFRQGAFQGRSPEEAYFVRCNKETTTQNDINLGIVNIVVGFAPLKPAEFVILKFQQIAGQIAV
jgi:uncharacterized protein